MTADEITRGFGIGLHEADNGREVESSRTGVVLQLKSRRNNVSYNGAGFTS